MLWRYLYRIVLFPLFILAIIVLAVFSKKIRNGFFGRLSSWVKINDFVSKSNNKDIYWFHAASLGEYEQIKPVLTGLKEVEPDSLFTVSYTH